MKKTPFVVVGVVAALLLVGYVVATLLVGSIVKAGVNRFASDITQTPVHLEGARLSPLSGSGTLRGLFVGNPTGWSGDKGFYIGKIPVKVAPGSLFSDCVVLTDVTIDEPEFVYETKVISSNISDLLQNIQGTKASESQRAQPVDGHG